MTIKELCALLASYPPDSLVILSKDGEGNAFSPLADANPGRYDARGTWSGDFLEEELIGDSEYSQPSEDAVPAVCLWPTN